MTMNMTPCHSKPCFANGSGRCTCCNWGTWPSVQYYPADPNNAFGKIRREVSELLPCPFCGTTPEIGGYPLVEIKCPQCRQARVEAAWYDGDMGTMHKAWNTRAARLPDREGWQDISSAPKDGTAAHLGFWYQERFAQYMGFFGPHGWMENSRSYFPEHMQGWFRYWRPLPAPPPQISTSEQRVP